MILSSIILKLAKMPWLKRSSYQDNNCFVNPNGDQIKKNILARHETVNKRVKQFFSACAVFVEIPTVNGNLATTTDENDLCSITSAKSVRQIENKEGLF